MTRKRLALYLMPGSVGGIMAILGLVANIGYNNGLAIGYVVLIAVNAAATLLILNIYRRRNWIYVTHKYPDGFTETEIVEDGVIRIDLAKVYK